MTNAKGNLSNVSQNAIRTTPNAHGLHRLEQGEPDSILVQLDSFVAAIAC
jgi:hypothetical protein